MIRAFNIIVFLMCGISVLLGQVTEEDVQMLNAAFDGDSAKISSLISKGANVNATSYEGTTPIMLASQNGHTKIVSMLLKNKAIIDARTPEGITALILAVSSGNIETAEFLIRNGANPGLADADGRSPLMHSIIVDSFYMPDMLLYYDADVNHKDNSNMDALLLACKHGRFEIAIKLLEAGADINSTDTNGNTPLHYAVISGKGTLTDLLIINGAVIDKKNNSGYTPLALAVALNRYDEALLLIGYGADINTRITASRNPLSLAIDNHNDSLIHLLKINGAFQIKRPDFSEFVAETGFTFNGSDSRINADFGLSDRVYLWMPSLNFGMRPSARFILDARDSSVYYQFRERRYFIGLDLSKGFFIHRYKSGLITAAFAGAGGMLTFGSYIGSSASPEPRLLFRPQIGVLLEYKPFRFKASYEFLDLDLLSTESSWFSLSLGVLINSRKKFNIQ